MAQTAQDNKFTIIGAVASYFTGNYGFVTAGMAADAQGKAVKAQNYQLEVAQRQEKMSARDREIARRKRLLQEVARRNVMASGVDPFTGSYMNLVNTDRADFQADILANEAMTASRVGSLQQQQRTNVAAGNTRTAGTLIGEYADYRQREG